MTQTSAPVTGAEPIPNVLSIAGSDPSGGAGIQADLKAIQATGGYGMAALTALTAQNTQGVTGVHPVPPAFVVQQLDAVAADIRIDAIKIGMLGSADTASAVADWLERLDERPVTVLDPVMVATSGDRLLDPDAERTLLRIAGLADVVTPNLPELAVLAGEPVADSWRGALAQARAVAARIGALVLAKGGHLGGAGCPDALVGASGVVAQFDGARIETTSTHGTGCTLSSALAAIHARRMRTPGEAASGAHADWAWSVALARDVVRGAIRAASALDVGTPGGHGPLDHGWSQRAGVLPPRRSAELDAWWEDILEIREGIMRDDFVSSLADGTLDRERFRIYLTQDAVYLRRYASVMSRAADLAPTAEEREFWRAASRSCVETEMALHRAHGADRDAPPSPQTAAYLAHLTDAADAGDYAVLTAAVLPCFWIYDDVGRQLVAGNHDGHPYGDWLETYADPAFAEAARRAREFAQRAARRAQAPTLARMRRAFDVASQLERDFFAQAQGVRVAV
ncbi:bifunctional hydroxymethylpyrimidine kinase/phosphomethylpyrimidine kinase [Microbacterium halophytorum]|uniref:bifunctional hydroxymethylpyrimidine kinase/phosphomethylpyrimidine kinase n=1 Tax=Microbacterium halophytorum TaxID=2067568 RepID=UPI000CFBC892|nr:bifunctional hydroxymethylpyrimidine kinase/phosphomethylpyrimidine kinase [Microbacterium halophytorum]